MEKNWFTVSNASGKKPCILIDGIISRWSDKNSYKAFRDTIDNLAKSNDECEIHFNSGGGDMVEGFAIYDHMMASSMKFKGKIVGMCASMAGPIALACDILVMSENATFMTHRPTGAAFGEKDQIESYAKLMGQLEDKAIAIFKKKTGQSDDEIKSWMKPGVDKWFTAKDCLKFKIIDSIAEPVKKGAPSNSVFNSLEDAWAVYNSFTSEPIIDNNMKKIILNVLSSFMIAHTLTEESTDDQFKAVLDSAFKGKIDQITNLEKQLKEHGTQAATELVDNAISEGKITADQREGYLNMAKADLTSAQDAISRIAGRVDVNSTLNKTVTPSATSKGKFEIPEDRKKWTYRDWEIKDQAGLTQMESLAPEVHDNLYKAFYNDEFERK